MRQDWSRPRGLLQTCPSSAGRRPTHSPTRRRRRQGRRRARAARGDRGDRDVGGVVPLHLPHGLVPQVPGLGAGGACAHALCMRWTTAFRWNNSFAKHVLQVKRRHARLPSSSVNVLCTVRPSACHARSHVAPLPAPPACRATRTPWCAARRCPPSTSSTKTGEGPPACCVFTLIWTLMQQSYPDGAAEKVLREDAVAVPSSLSQSLRLCPVALQPPATTCRA